MQTKLAVRDFTGKPKAYFLVDREDLGASNAPDAVPDPSHHIIVLDVSGSMYYDMDSMRATIEKVLTLDEFANDALKVSLISYSSHGDCRIHFQKVTVAEVMAPGSPHLQEIRNLRVRGLTGMSQALQTAETLIDDSEVTAISLHTDGYANDPSPYSEAQHLVAVVDAIAKHPQAFCNTVAYRDWCDFPLLTAIANKLSGVCVQAKNIKQVYQALHDTTALLSSKLAPVIEAGIGDYDLVAFLSARGEKILGGTESLKVRGVAETDDQTIYRYRQISAEDYMAAPAPVDEGLPLLVLARVQAALGNLNLAKYAMITTRNTAFHKHARALVASDVAAMVADLDRHLFQTLTIAGTKDYGLGQTGPSILDVLGVLGQFQQSIRVNVKELAKGYKRRGLKKVAGKRLEDGSIQKPEFELRGMGGEWLPISGIDINRNAATANIRLMQDSDLVRTADGTVISEIEGIPIKLKDYRNYTVVGDGAVNLPLLPIRTSDKRCFAALEKLGLVSGDFDPNVQVDIDLSKLPVIGYDATFNIPDGVPDTLLKLLVVQKILAGILKESSAEYTPEQVAALKAHDLSPALYFNAPTTVPYTDLTAAIGRGEVDTRLSYKVELGTMEITNPGKLKSGNAYLQRRYTRTDGSGADVAKPTLDMLLQDGQWGIKKLTARTKLDAVDDLSFPIYQAFLGMDPMFLTELAVILDWDAGDIHDLEVAFGYHAETVKMDTDGIVELLTTLQKVVSVTIDEMYRKHVAPVAFYVGSTGLVPDSFGAGPAMTAEQLTKKHPSVKLEKAEKEEGVFYELPNGILLTVYTKAEHFSTEAGVKVATAL